MSRRARFALIVAVCLPLMAPGCGAPPVVAGTDGVFTFGGQRVYYSAPAHWSKILFVMHGQSRNADGYRDAWTDADALVLVPEFTDAAYPGDAYTLGPDSYTKLEPLFDFVRTEQTTYSLYGFSAGAQYVHRFLLTTPNRASKVVAASAGWWTVAEDVPWPYGWRGHESLAWLAAPMTIMVGTADNDPNAADLRHTPEAERQGANRLERARYMHAHGPWPYIEVAGVGHSNAEMVPYAQTVLGVQ